MVAQVAAGIVRGPGGRILIAERFRPCPQGGRWEFPGGTREEGETLEGCLRRELREELAIEVRVDEPLVVIERPYADCDLDLHAFLCTWVSGEPEAIECAAWRWVDLEELHEGNFTGADRRILAALERWAKKSG